MINSSYKYKRILFRYFDYFDQKKLLSYNEIGLTLYGLIQKTLPIGPLPNLLSFTLNGRERRWGRGVVDNVF